jgi:hypothetical protein
VCLGVCVVVRLFSLLVSLSLCVGWAGGGGVVGEGGGGGGGRGVRKRYVIP